MLELEGSGVTNREYSGTTGAASFVSEEEALFLFDGAPLESPKKYSVVCILSGDCTKRFGGLCAA